MIQIQSPRLLYHSISVLLYVSLDSKLGIDIAIQLLRNLGPSENKYPSAQGGGTYIHVFFFVTLAVTFRTYFHLLFNLIILQKPEAPKLNLNAH